MVKSRYDHSVQVAKNQGLWQDGVMRGTVLFVGLAMGLLGADAPKGKPVPVRVIQAREVTPAGEVVEVLVRGSDERWHVRGEKLPFTGKVGDKVFGREHETSYLKGLRHGPYVIIHRNGVTAAQGVFLKGKRVKHREWDMQGGQIELDAWNFDGTPKKPAPKNLK